MGPQKQRPTKASFQIVGFLDYATQRDLLIIGSAISLCPSQHPSIWRMLSAYKDFVDTNGAFHEIVHRNAVCYIQNHDSASVDASRCHQKRLTICNDRGKNLIRNKNKYKQSFGSPGNNKSQKLFIPLFEPTLLVDRGELTLLVYHFVAQKEIEMFFKEVHIEFPPELYTVYYLIFTQVRST